MTRGKIWVFGALLLAPTLLLAIPPLQAHAAQSTDFSLQVTPSPLVTTVKPGEKTQVELSIHNGGNGSEDLKIEPRSFNLTQDSSTVTLLDTTPPDIADWISFSQPKFTIQSGQSINETITFNVPKSAGFSYSFALVVSRQTEPKPTSGGRLIKGSLAIFTLVNVDRPGATSNLQVINFKASKKVYEYLPATISVQFRNTGNTIAQPYGNIFIQRKSGSSSPLATLVVNETRGYILPGTTRTITADWNDGFPSYKNTINADGSTSQKLVWDWSKLSKLRIGRYTAHLVAVYNQAGRDIPIDGEVTFWVIPWKLLLIPIVILLLIIFAFVMIIRIVLRGAKRRKTKKDKNKPSQTPIDD